MTTADKIGLLPGFGWVAGLGWVATLLITWCATPVLPIAVGLIGESRIIPLLAKRQFRGFFPGDLFLGGALTLELMLAKRLPAHHAWYNAWWWHLAVFLFCLGLAIKMTRDEWEKSKTGAPDAYEPRAVKSPTKLYHNFVLYWLYGYVTGSTFVAVMFGTWSPWLFAVCGLLFVWAALNAYDNIASDAIKEYRAHNAHVGDWQPIWKTRRVSGF